LGNQQSVAVLTANFALGSSRCGSAFARRRAEYILWAITNEPEFERCQCLQQTAKGLHQPSQVWSRPGSQASQSHRPATKPQRWADAVGELLNLLDGYQQAWDILPDSTAVTTYVEKLDAILELRELAEILAGAEFPKGFGRH
jgi:hypothetical protein